MLGGILPSKKLQETLYESRREIQRHREIRTTGRSRCTTSHFPCVVPATGVAGAAAVEGLVHFRTGGLGGRDGGAIKVDCCEEGTNLLRGCEADQRREDSEDGVESEKRRRSHSSSSVMS